MYLLPLAERLSQRCHLFRIGEVLMFDDSMMDLRSEHDLTNSNELSVYMTFGLCDGSKNFNNFFRLM